MDTAGAGVRASQTVDDLTAGSWRRFEDRGGLAERLPLEKPTGILPGDWVTTWIYDVCTG
jgi:hypothetical protein